MSYKSLRGRMPNGEANPVDVHVGERIRLRRLLLGLSQEKLAKMLGLTFQQVQKYERGMNRIGASRLWDMSKILNVPVNFFFEEMDFSTDENSPASISGGAKLIAENAAVDPMDKAENIELISALNKIKNPELKESLRKAIISASKIVYASKIEE